MEVVYNKPKRLLSIDALRGFDMLLISGGGTFMVLLQGKTGWPWCDWIAEQLVHAKWDGFTFYDFIFPLFLFISGLSLSFSLKGRILHVDSKAKLYWTAMRRALILICLGILDKNAPLDLFDPGSIRYGTVLGRIGIATFIVTVLYLNAGIKQRILWVVAILISYCAALYLIPVPGFGVGDLSFEGNLPGWIDRTFMPGRLLQKTYDQLALGTLPPAISVTICGSLAGDMLLYSRSGRLTTIRLFLIGAAAVLLGLLWGTVFPINKHLWSSSFVLLTSGMSFISLSVFYGLIDVCGYAKWAFFFKVIGMNSLVIYLLDRFVDFKYTSHLLFGGLIGYFDDKWQAPLGALASLVIVWSFLYFLYRNKVFVKI